MTIYPAIDIKDGRCVRLMRGDFESEKVYYGDPAEAAKNLQNSGAEFIHVVDLNASRSGRACNDVAIEKITKTVSIPVQVGGGIRSILDIERLFGIGASRVILGTAAVENKELAKNAINKFGDRVAIGIDALAGNAATRGWARMTEVDPVTLALEMKKYGAETVIFTNIANDGMLAGPDIESTSLMIKKTGMKIIASGGVRSITDLPKLKEIGAAGVIIGKALYEGLIDLSEAIKCVS